MIKVMIKRLDPNVEIPGYKTAGSSGVDLMANLNEKITEEIFRYLNQIKL